MKNKQWTIHLGLIGTLLIVGLDVLLFPLSSDARIFLILGLYFMLYYRFSMKSQMTLGLAFTLLIVTYMQFMSTDQNIFVSPDAVPLKAERMAVWVYLFMGIGIIQQWREYLRESREYKKKKKMN